MEINFMNILIAIVLYTTLIAFIITTIRVFVAHIRGEKVSSPFFESLASILFFLTIFNFFFGDHNRE
jgi:energy-coupling factor transporter transmembrane protein EcfT